MPLPLSRLADIFLAPVTRLFDHSEQTLWVSYLGALMVAIFYYLWHRRHRKTSLKGLRRYLFPKKLIQHPSTRLDLKMYLFSSLYLALQSILLFGGMDGLSQLLLHLTEPLTGAGATAHPLPLWALIVLPPVIYLTLEFGYWLAHYLLHHIPWLWEFHKVHHSAEIMTPLTEWRQHPVEFFLVPFVMGITTSVVLAIIEWFLGPNLIYALLWNPNLILLGFVITYLHLRHSHVKLSATGWLGHILQSPAHHQIHHSTDPRHFDKNLGFCLSVWDYVFGTLYLPKKGEILTLGLYDERGDKDELVTSTSLWRHMILPFQRIWAITRPGPRPHPVALPTSPQ